MKLVGYEWYKIFKNRVFPLLFVGLMLANILCFHMQEKQLSSDVLAQDSIEQQEKYQKKYKVFLEQMEERMQRMFVLSAFQKNAEFSHKNIKKTVEDYKGLEKLKLECGNNLGINRLTENKMTDIFAVFLVFLLCVELFLREVQEGTLLLIRSKQRGRLYLALCKIGSLMVGAIGIGVFLYGGDFVYCKQVYGYDKLYRFVQSIPDFQNAIYPIEVGQYLCLYLALKIVALCVVASVIGFLFLIFTKKGYLYVSCAMVIGVEVVFFNKIPEASNWNYLKYVNIFYLLKSDGLIKNYCNLNIFGEPVEKNVCCFALALVVILLFISVGTFLYANRQENRSMTRLEQIWRVCKKRIFPGTHGHTSLVLHEAYKCFWSGKCIILCIALGLGSLWMVRSASEPFNNQLVSATYCSYIRTFAGTVTEDKKLALYLEGIRTANSVEDIYENMASKTRKTADKERIKLSIYGMDNFYKIEGFDEVLKQYRSVRNKKVTGDKIALVNQYGGKEIFLDSRQDILQMLGIAICMVFFISVLFSAEYKYKMDCLIRTMKYGRSFVYRKRAMLALGLCSYCFIIVYAPEVWYVLRYYGLRVLQGQLCDLPDAMAQGKQTILCAWTLLLLIRYGCLVLITAAITWLSRVCKNGILTMLIGSGCVILLGCLLYEKNTLRIGYWLCQGHNNIEIGGILLVLIVGSIVLFHKGKRCC